MDCKKTVIDQQNSFIERYTNHNTEIINFYGYKPGTNLNSKNARIYQLMAEKKHFQKSYIIICLN